MPSEVAPTTVASLRRSSKTESSNQPLVNAAAASRASASSTASWPSGAPSIPAWSSSIRAPSTLPPSSSGAARQSRCPAARSAAASGPVVRGARSRTGPSWAVSAASSDAVPSASTRTSTAPLSPAEPVDLPTALALEHQRRRLRLEDLGGGAQERERSPSGGSAGRTAPARRRGCRPAGRGRAGPRRSPGRPGAGRPAAPAPAATRTAWSRSASTNSRPEQAVDRQARRTSRRRPSGRSARRSVPCSSITPLNAARLTSPSASTRQQQRQPRPEGCPAPGRTRSRPTHRPPVASDHWAMLNNALSGLFCRTTRRDQQPRATTRPRTATARSRSPARSPPRSGCCRRPARPMRNRTWKNSAAATSRGRAGSRYRSSCDSS